jgi:DMSO/TMAO reductase YedYZ molybdopterin-dependent catalytic subunit
MRKFSRREFIALGTVGLVVAASGTARIVLQPPSRPEPTTSTQNTLQPQNNTSTIKYSATSLPLPIWITANQDFYTVQYDQPPSTSLTSWSLTIHGLVREPLRLTYDEVHALPAVTRMHTLECIGNAAGSNLIGNAEWRGIELRALLGRAGVDAKATRVTIGGVDEYFTSVPLERAMHEHAILAYEMNGQPLPPDHGYPLRAILPGVYGQKQPKWVTGIKVTDEEDLGPWEQKGWSRSATIQLNSAIKLPDEAHPVPRGDILIAGVAHADEIGVRMVQVSTDEGKTWNETVLTRGPSPYVWTQWGYLFKKPAPGRYTVMVRAIDNRGAMQDQMDASLLANVFPNGTSAIHSIVIQVAE